jgi:hypothetical protein
MPKHKVGDHVLVKLSGGRIVEATVKAIVDTTEGMRLQVDFGFAETALVSGPRCGPVPFSFGGSGGTRTRLTGFADQCLVRFDIATFCKRGQGIELGEHMIESGRGLVAELADAHGLGPCGVKPVKVRVLSGPPNLAHSGTLSWGEPLC